MRLPSPMGAQNYIEGYTGSLSRSEAMPGPDGQPRGLQIGYRQAARKTRVKVLLQL